ncbi:Pol polyprotein [Plakobranchus ocellatus]|uniref:Pol polyprotein n=1 Tax=Plakobranchus ocellatus TaxID=259542 RepID=A0AAV4BV65_9GAST|nr:Pol polyprotein [Plakobranchus ocellatus]
MEDLPPWSSGWRGSKRPSSRDRGECSGAPRPETKKEVCPFCRISYWLPKIAAPLSDLVRKAQPNPVTRSDAQERAYHSLKIAVISRPVLHQSEIGLPSTRTHLIVVLVLL